MSNVAQLLDEQVGIFEGISNEAYHAGAGLSSSGLKYLAKSPAHYRAYKENPPEPSAEMRMGTAAHGAILEGYLENGMILKAPGSTRNTNLYKDFVKANPGRIHLMEDEFEAVHRMRDAVLSHPVARSLLSGGKAEQSAFWRDPETDTLCKCRPDYLRPDGLVVDLKTSLSAARKDFQRSMLDFKYHWQTAWYLNGLSLLTGKALENFVHIVVERVPPYGVGIFVLDNASIEKARSDIRQLLSRYADCVHSDEWPTYPAEIQNIELPHWVFEQELV